MKRIYHPYHAWEELDFGMWANVPRTEVEMHLKAAIRFTGDAELYGLAMLRVINEWPVSCEHNLTDRGINRQAWIGHAAAALAIGCPEHITRMAWGRLTQQQQDAATAKALEAIDLWTERHESKNQAVHRTVGKARLPGRHTRRSAGKTGSIEQGSVIPTDLQSHPEE